MITAKARIITVTLNATATTAIRTITPGRLPDPLCAILRAMNSSRFTLFRFCTYFSCKVT